MIDGSELIFVVDENNNPLQPQARNIVHANKIWHRTAHVWVMNTKKQILCQKRSLKKDRKAGLWEARFGGHLCPKENYLSTAVREASEELGLHIKPNYLHELGFFRSLADCEFQGEFSLAWNGGISLLKFEKEEIDQLKWLAFEQLRQIFRAEDKNWAISGFEQEILDMLGRQ